MVFTFDSDSVGSQIETSGSDSLKQTFIYAPVTSLIGKYIYVPYGGANVLFRKYCKIKNLVGEGQYPVSKISLEF